VFELAAVDASRVDTLLLELVVLQRSRLPGALKLPEQSVNPSLSVKFSVHGISAPAWSCQPRRTPAQNKLKPKKNPSE